MPAAMSDLLLDRGQAYVEDSGGASWERESAAKEGNVTAFWKFGKGCMLRCALVSR